MLAVVPFVGGIYWIGLLGASPSVPSRGPAVAVGELMEFKGLTTRFASDERSIGEVSAQQAIVSRSRAFGPFRFGFLRSVEAMGVEFVLRADGLERQPIETIGQQLANRLGRTHAELVGAVDLYEVRIVLEGEHGERQPILTAARCSAGRDGLSCSRGRLAQQNGSLGFRRVTFAGDGIDLRHGRDVGMSIDLRMLATMLISEKGVWLQ